MLSKWLLNKMNSQSIPNSLFIVHNFQLWLLWPFATNAGLVKFSLILNKNNGHNSVYTLWLIGMHPQRSLPGSDHTRVPSLPYQHRWWAFESRNKIVRHILWHKWTHRLLLNSRLLFYHLLLPIHFIALTTVSFEHPITKIVGFFWIVIF